MALSKALQAKIKAAQKNWGKAKTRAVTEKGGFADIEDGRYIARLTGAEMAESKSSGRLQVVWDYKILEGDYKGVVKKDFDGLETEDNLMYLARKLAKYGYEAPDDLEEVEALLTEIVKEKPMVKIRLKTKGGASDFQNVYIDTVYDKADEEEVLQDAAADATAGDDEVAEETTEEEATEEEATEEATEEEASEEEEAVAEEDEAELEVGLRVMVMHKGAEVVGTVIEILNDESKVRVKMDADNKVIRVPIDALAAAPDEEEAAAEETTDEEEDVPETPAPVKPGKKAPAPAPVKPAPAPAKKPAPAAAPAKPLGKKK